MEYLYGNELTGVIDRTTVPIFRETLPVILRKEFGPDWYQNYAEPIMNNYPDYGRLFIREMDPLSSFDISALWFLMFPYDPDETENGVKQFPGAGVYFAKDRGLSEEDLELISGLRTLRNSLIHKNVRKYFILPAHKDDFEVVEQTRLINGQVKTIRVVNYTGPDMLEGQRIIHEDAFDYISKASAKLNPQAAGIIAEARTRIMKDLESEVSKNRVGLGSPDPESDRRFTEYMSVITAMRREYNDIHDVPWVHGPIGQPLEGAAPWISLQDDLDTLDWPEINQTAQSPAADRTSANTTGSSGSGSGAEELVQETLKGMAQDAKDLYKAGKSLFGDLFGKRR